MKKYIQKVFILTTCEFQRLNYNPLQQAKFVPPVDGHQTTGKFIPSLHGFNGVISGSLPGNYLTIDSVSSRLLNNFPNSLSTKIWGSAISLCSEPGGSSRPLEEAFEVVLQRVTLLRPTAAQILQSSSIRLQ
jgi:hypothetical protein